MTSKISQISLSLIKKADNKIKALHVQFSSSKMEEQKW